MGDYKFDTFYYSIDKSNKHYLSEIENLPEGAYNCLYNGKMYCPLCKSPKLSRVRKEGNTFLRTYPNQPHILVDGEMCLYEYNTISKKGMDEYIEELREKNKIKSLLEAIMRRMFKQNSAEVTISKDTENQFKNPLIVERVQSDKTVKRKIIPHYRFRSWGKNIPQDRLLVVYGKVYIELRESNNVNKEGKKTTQTYIHFKDIHSKKLITSCRKPNGLEVYGGYYYAVVLGQCYSRSTDQGHIYYNIRVNFPDSQSILLKSFSP